MPCVLYAGLNEITWRRMLSHDDVAVRLFAMRVMARHGELGASILRVHQPRSGPTLFPWIWAMSQCSLSGPHLEGDGPRAMARYLARRAGRAHAYPSKMSRSACADAIVAAVHPQKMLACAVRLLDLYGADAIQPLLDVIRYTPVAEGVVTRDYVNEKAACAAWALGQLGRVSVPEIVQAYGKGSERCRAHLALALWYLGPEAARALPVLLDDDSEEASAALLAMESAAGTALVERGRGPIWLDDANLCALASYAYGDSNHEYAAAALCCFGPVSLKALPVLSYLARDVDVAVRRTLARALGWGGRTEVRPVLLVLLDDDDGGVRNLARSALLALYQSEGSEALMDGLRSGPEGEKRIVAMALAERKLARTLELAAILENAEPAVTVTLLKAIDQPGLDDGFREPLLRLAGNRSVDVRLWAAKIMQRLVDLTALVEPTCALLKGEHNPDVAEQLLQVLALSRTPIAELPLAENLALMPIDAVIRLVGAFEVTAPDLVAWIRSPDAAIRKMAARALALLDVSTPEIVDALRVGLHDPENEVVVACARAFERLGIFEESWRLFYSHDEQYRQTAADRLLKASDLPADFLAAFSDGELPISPEVLRALNALLPPTQAAQQLAAALPRVVTRRPAPEQALLLDELGWRGLFALPVLPELVGHRDGRVRQQALRALELVLRSNSLGHRHWVAEHAMVFPLDHPDEATRHRLHDTLSAFLVASRSWEDPRVAPLLDVLLRSPNESIAGRALRCRALMDDPALALVSALDHPHAAVRLEALQSIARILPPYEAGRRQVAERLAACAPESDEDVRLHRLSLAFRLDALPGDELLQAFRDLAAGSRLASGLFLPERPPQLRALASLLFDVDQAVGQLAMVKLLTYMDELEEDDTVQLVRALRHPHCAGHIHVLVNRWPELIPLALREESDWSELPRWLVDLAEAAEPGLVVGLTSPDRNVRLVCLDVTRRLGTVGSSLLLRTGNLQVDPDPEVAERATETVRRISLRRRSDTG